MFHSKVSLRAVCYACFAPNILSIETSVVITIAKFRAGVVASNPRKTPACMKLSLAPAFRVSPFAGGTQLASDPTQAITESSNLVGQIPTGHCNITCHDLSHTHPLSCAEHFIKRALPWLQGQQVISLSKRETKVQLPCTTAQTSQQNRSW